MIVVDSRWVGRHGIARFASEVVPRLRWRSVGERRPVSPTSMLDVVAPWRFGARPTDVVYSPGFNAGWTRARQVLTLHDLIHLDEPAERSAAKTMYYARVVRPAIARAGVVLTVSRTSQQRILEWLDDTSIEVVDVGNGCSDLFFDQRSSPPPASGRFLYVGNLKPHKNVDVLFAALTQRTGFRLTVVTGDRDRAAALAAEHGVTDQVDVRSGLTDGELVELYRHHDAVLLPSRLEGFGLPALEAIAAGRRVGYSNDCDSVREIVGEEGIAVSDSGDPDEWAAAMDRLMAAGSSSAAESEGWRERYGWDGVARRVRRAVLDHAI